MALGINRINPSNKILTTFDNVIYKFNEYEWIKCEPYKEYDGQEWHMIRAIKLHKYYDVNSTADFDDNEMIDGDYVATYVSNGNYIKGSETLDDNSRWTKVNTSVIRNHSIIMPNNKGYCFAIYSSKDNSPKEHYIAQDFITEPDKNYCFSSFAHIIPNREPTKIGMSIYLDSYDLNLCCIYDVKDSTGYIDGYKDLTANIFFRNSEKVINTTPSQDDTPEEQAEKERWATIIADNFSNYSAGIEIIPVVKDEIVDYYFRPYLISKINGNSFGKLKLVQLNTSDEWMFADNEEQYGTYISGFQLEKSSNTLVHPTAYINCPGRTPEIRRTFKNLYIYNNNRYELQENKKIYYVNDVTERHISTLDTNQNGIEYTIMESSTPEIKNPKINEIAIVSSVITFTVDDLAPQEEHLSGVVLGNNYNENDPYYTIYYDTYDNVYKIKIPVLDDNGNPIYDARGFEDYEYMVLQGKSDEEVKSLITKSLIYNQGYFETYCQYSNFRPSFNLGYNTGGGCNFWKSRYFKTNGRR